MITKLINTIVFTSLTLLGVMVCESGQIGTTSNDEGDGSVPTIDSNCNSTSSRLKKFLLDAGYNKNAVAGIMGNLLAESGISINSLEKSYTRNQKLMPLTTSFIAYDLSKKGAEGKNFSGGFGIAQWTSWGRVRNLQLYADSHAGGIVVSEKAQFGFLLQELTKSYDLSPDKLNKEGIEGATWLVQRDYETPKSVFCTENNPCTTYSLDCPSNYPCRYTGKISSNGKKEVAYWNVISARRVSYSEITNNQMTYWPAWKSLNNRIKKAKSVDFSSIDGCSANSDADSDSSGSNSIPTNSSDSSSQPAVTSPSSVKSGNVGADSSNCIKFYCQDKYKDTVWRKNGGTISNSGCSLIAVANAAKYLGVTPNDPKTLADYTRSRITDEKQTGWGSNSKSVEVLLAYTKLNQTGILWDNYSVSTEDKIEKIRETLSSGGVVIAGGDRKRGPHKLVSCLDKASGNCVFSYNGHFVAIVGITADNRLVIANPATGNGGTNIYNANNVLKFSNKAIGVKQ